MTNKFQSYVDSIEEKNKFKLLLIPIFSGYSDNVYKSTINTSFNFYF